MTSSSILVAVLAAGRASRFGGAKLAQPCAGKPLGWWALDVATASGLPVIAIVNSAQDWLEGAACEVLVNPDSQSGIGTSIALAARTARDRTVESLLIMLADMPLVDEEVLAGLIAGQAPVACLYPGSRAGVPARFPRSAFDALCELQGDHGAGALLAKLDGLAFLEVSPDKLLDVDTPAELAVASDTLAARFTPQEPR